MSDLIIPNSSDFDELSRVVALPLPRSKVTVRPGVMSDLPFLDSLQKLHTNQVGWMPTAQLEGKIKLGHVLIAELDGECVGYCIGNDQYFKRDDVGIIYQLNVTPGKQRGFIGASLLKAQFDRSAYGCKLYCCWCAQDIAANRFWEAMGFVPLAFRAGSEKRGKNGGARVHIFWQKRIRADDATTPWWFPSKTSGGSIREDRIVLPIPPGTHWSDAKPLLLPAAELPVASGQLPVAEKKPRAKKPRAVESPPPIRRNGLVFDIPRQGEALPETKVAKSPKPKSRRVKRTCDPRVVSAARELRDRWLEHVNADPSRILGAGKYEVSRALPDGATASGGKLVHATPTLPAPAPAPAPAPKAA